VLSALELEADADRIVQIVPSPVALLPFCTIVPTSSLQIPTVTNESQIDDADFAEDGQNLPGLTGAGAGGWTVDYLEAKRVGRNIPVPLEVLDDAGQAEAIVDRLITQNFRRRLETLAVTGNITNLTGVTNTAGVATISASGSNLVDPLAAAVADISSAGFYGPYVIAAHPLTLEAIWTQKDSADNYLRVRSALPMVQSWAPAPGLSTGTAVVGDFSELLIYLQGAFTIAITQAYLDFLSRGMALVKGVQRAAIWVKSPGAFTIITNL
jgi:HK97 family phage major capsid protein